MFAGIQFSPRPVLLQPAEGEDTLRGTCQHCGAEIHQRIAVPVERDAHRGVPATVIVWVCLGCPWFSIL